MNLDDTSGDGTHWVAWFKRGNEKWYFDSFRLPPPTELNNFLNSDVFYPTEQIQPRQEVLCGHLCLFVLKEMQTGEGLQEIIIFGDIINMPVDKFGRSPKTGQNVTKVSGVSYEYVNSNVLRKGQAIDMSGQSIVNLGKSRGSKDAVRRKYVNEIFFKKGDPINMNQKAIKNVLSPTEEGDAVTKGYVDSKRAGESDLNMNRNSIRHVNQTPTR